MHVASAGGFDRESEGPILYLANASCSAAVGSGSQESATWVVVLAIQCSDSLGIKHLARPILVLVEFEKRSRRTIKNRDPRCAEDQLTISVSMLRTPVADCLDAQFSPASRLQLSKCASWCLCGFKDKLILGIKLQYTLTETPNLFTVGSVAGVKVA